jgi:hypothetical protein
MRPPIPVGPNYGWVIAGTLTILLAASHGLLGTGISVFDAAILEDLGISRAAACGRWPSGWRRTGWGRAR